MRFQKSNLCNQCWNLCNQIELVFGRYDIDPIRWVEMHHAILQGKQRKIAALTYEEPGFIVRTLLTDQNTSGGHHLPAETFDAEALRIGIAAVF